MTSQPKPVTINKIHSPSKFNNIQDIELCVDIVFINKMAFMTCIDDPIQHRSAIHPPNRTADELHIGIDKNTRLCDKASHEIKRIHMDMEFKPTMDKVEDELDIDMNCANRGDHVPHAEKNN